jgi:hypothetical protein
MGLDRTWQAIPVSSPLIERARGARAKDDRDFGECLLYATNVFRQPALAAGYREVGRCVSDLVADDPTIATRSYDSERRNWDHLHYVLSENRRSSHYGCEPRGRDRLYDVAMRGEEVLFDYARAGTINVIGVRYSEPALVQQVVSALETMSHEYMRLSYVPGQMERDGVYKFAATRGEEYWGYIREAFDNLRTFYRAAAESGEGVAVFTT